MKGREPYLTMKEAAALSAVEKERPIRETLIALKLDAGTNISHLSIQLQSKGLIEKTGERFLNRAARVKGYGADALKYKLTPKGGLALEIWSRLINQILSLSIEHIETKPRIEGESKATIRPLELKGLPETIADEIISIRNNSDNSAKSKGLSKKHYTHPSRKNNPEFDVSV